MRYHPYNNNNDNNNNNNNNNNSENDNLVSRSRKLTINQVTFFPSVQHITTKLNQQPIVGKNKPDPSGGRNQKEALEVNRTHIEESTELRHKTSPHMEPSRPKEKRRTKEHNTPRKGNRHDKNEQQSDRTRKEGPGQSGLENAKWRPMLDWE
ncbi:unnamed protein product [Schistosoma curassoni]|uniref:GATA zinc finger domain-containing protein 14-like n=1 Tax=Schistosoma curassoni TaxID=6186 RepID=A0A183K3I2_9TREM|nr:unnamed protein product [Schistosoma curassoni]